METAADRRVGLFGGTFDPPHLGHASAARDVADALDLDEVVWIVARRSPLKPDTPPTSGQIRLRMVEAAVEGDPRFRVSDVELAREGPSFTVDTLRALRRGELSDAELFLIIGIDQYRAFEAWHRPDEVRRLATLAVMDREGEGVDVDASDSGMVRVPVRRVDISSTEVRAAAARGCSIGQMVRPEVARIIEEKGLYREADRETPWTEEDA